MEEGVCHININAEDKARLADSAAATAATTEEAVDSATVVDSDVEDDEIELPPPLPTTQPVATPNVPVEEVKPAVGTKKRVVKKTTK
jgi:hypothetical protein